MLDALMQTDLLANASEHVLHWTSATFRTSLFHSSKDHYNQHTVHASPAQSVVQNLQEKRALHKQRVEKFELPLEQVMHHQKERIRFASRS
jgi:hypothetical protein